MGAVQFTLGTAAKRLGISKPTLSKHIRNGKLSAKKLESGAFAIDGAELARFESEYRKSAPAGEVKAEAAPAAEGEAVALAVVQERARQLEERLAETADRLAKAEARAEAAQAKADEAWQRVAGLLEGPKPPARGLWSRLFGG